MKSGLLCWSLLVCAHTFTADQLSLSEFYASDERPLQLYEPSVSDEDILEKMRAAATPLWRGKDFEKMLIEVPGEHRFYQRVDLRDGITGLLSGASKIDVEIVALQMTLDSKEDARGMVLKLQDIYNVALAEKKLEKMCDILLPDELGKYVADLEPCTHENNQCNNYWSFVKATLEQHTAQSIAKHFGVILVPYQQ